MRKAVLTTVPFFQQQSENVSLRVRKRLKVSKFPEKNFFVQKKSCGNGKSSFGSTSGSFLSEG